ncbi:MAG TPA: DUF4331 family protein [Flavobacteriaceae bacterium]|nr:DUF4331 family protein [Flavobacteriaceae bacterium]HPF12412.1 DUF4331 family protein [Flavobacteriaceae bacterium]HQU21596.1 DUF4331 family protein [Flavobacteriaceae bacterium]HQU66153.1 DUF4331 family protein [Flavobacteriaceae bacterium]HRW45753.1 DUF4331 family protein [Flavobacteriaceae bacterium]
MKKKKIYLLFGSFGLLMLLVTLIAADHIDSPSVANTSVDIADFFAFEGDNPDNTVFVATMQGPLTPGAVTENAIFDEDVLVEFNIDKTGDFVEDLVIQAIRRDSIMYFFGPSVVDPADAGLNSKIYVDDFVGQVEISGTDETITASANGMTFFAGPRRDPFYFDFNQFNQVVSGNAAPEGFLPPAQASDFFINLNVLAVSVEVPNSMLGDAPPHVAGAVGIDGLPNAYNVWVTTKRKQ